MGRSSLEATKLLCSLIVLEAVDFFRGACPFFALDEDFLLLADALDVVFFLLDECVAVEDGELWAGKALLCSISPAKTVAVIRLKNIVSSSLTL
jgi:hypothetical protein